MSPEAPGPEVVAEALVRYANELNHLPPDELPDLIRRTCAVLGGDDVDIRLVDLTQQWLVSLDSDEESFFVEGTVAGRAYRSDRITIQTDGSRRRLWIPLLDSSERLGVLGVTVPGTEPELDEEDRDLWQAIGSLVGEAVVSNASYGDTIALARGMDQTSLAAELRWGQLPPLTYRAPEVTVSGILEPALDIAGDTFDYAVSSRDVQVAILDAMGHGLEASRMANLAVATYRHARRHGRDIGEMLSAIDEVISSEFGDHRFVTGQLATLDLDDGRFRLVNAGHPLPLHFRSSRYLGPIDCTPCPPLGLGRVRTVVAETSLEPGDAVLLYTDGVIESRNSRGSELGEDWLADLVARHLRSEVGPPEVLRQVVRALYEQVGPALHDDATLVLVRWEGPPGNR